jgi:hypothetical protein
MKSSSICGSWLVALAAACANHSIELSTPPKLEASTEPTTLGRINEQVGWLTVDSERLYWTGKFSGPNVDPTSNQTGTALHSCLKDRCSSSLVTYDPSNVDLAAGFGLYDGEIYWRTTTTGDMPSTAIVACPKAGCAGQRRVLHREQLSYPGRLTLGADGIYFRANQGLFRLGYTGAESPELVTFIDAGYLASAVNEGFLYWLSQAETGRSTLYRTRTDGSSPTETLADQLKVLPSYTPQNTAGYTFLSLAFDEAYVYWTENTLTGSLMRCPLAGCSAAPEVIAAPIRAPVNLRPDGERAYFQYDDTLLGNSLSSCVLARCAPSAPIVSGLNGWNAMTFDERYIYAATTEQKPNPDQYWDTPSASIRRFPKD